MSHSISEYARDIWNLVPARRPHPTEEDMAGVGMARCARALLPHTRRVAWLTVALLCCGVCCRGCRVRSFPNFDPNSMVELHMSPSPTAIAASLRRSPAPV
jgi:hypothetical protein